MKSVLRKSVSAPLNAFDYGAKDDSFIEVTEWTNGEGYDIVIDNRQYSLSAEEIAAINYMTAHLEYAERANFK